MRVVIVRNFKAGLIKLHWKLQGKTTSCGERRERLLLLLARGHNTTLHQPPTADKLENRACSSRDVDLEEEPAGGTSVKALVSAGVARVLPRPEYISPSYRAIAVLESCAGCEPPAAILHGQSMYRESASMGITSGSYQKMSSRPSVMDWTGTQQIQPIEHDV
jgi:hypothetical protein